MSASPTAAYAQCTEYTVAIANTIIYAAVAYYHRLTHLFAGGHVMGTLLTARSRLLIYPDQDVFIAVSRAYEAPSVTQYELEARNNGMFIVNWDQQWSIDFTHRNGVAP